MKEKHAMSRKSKGIGAERELVHMFMDSGWAALRVAGSGVLSGPDVMASNAIRRLVIECKTTKDGNKYLTLRQIDELRDLAEKFGGEPWVAVKYKKTGWFFLSLEDLNKTPLGYSVDSELARRKGLLFSELIV